MERGERERRAKNKHKNSLIFIKNQSVFKREFSNGTKRKEET